MDLAKSYDFFQPEKVRERIHIIGCGSGGSAVAVLLARCGLKNITLWDFDIVESHNVANQQYTSGDIGRPKVEALRDIMLDINPDMESGLKLKPNGWDGEVLSGYIFLCVDSIELRKRIVETHMSTTQVKAVFDFRNLLESAQHYAADWSNYTHRQNLLGSMQFTDEEAAAETPVSACGVTLGVATTSWLGAACVVSNFVHFAKGGELKTMMCVDAETYGLVAFPMSE